MEAKINTQHTAVWMHNGKTDLSLYRVKAIKAIERDGSTWIDFTCGKDEVTVFLSEENLPQLKEAIEKIERFYMKEVVL